MGKSIIVGPVLLVFESIKRPRKAKNQDGTDRIKYECTVAFQAGSPAHQAMLPLEQEAKVTKFGPQYTGPYRSPFRDDFARDLFDQQSGIGVINGQYNPNDPNAWRQKNPILIGKIAVNLKSNDPIRPFHSVGGKSVAMTDEEVKTKFYPGIEVYFETNAYSYSQPGQTPGVSFGLNSIFKHADGTPLISVSDGARTFAEIAANPLYAAQNPQMFPPQQAQPARYEQIVNNPQFQTPYQQPFPQQVAQPAPPVDPAYAAWLQAQERQRQLGQF